MEGGEGSSSGVKVKVAEATSDHDISPRSEAPSQGGSVPEATAEDIVGSPTNLGSDETVGKKKRGRPRKSGTDGSNTGALSSLPMSSALLGDSVGTSFRPHIILVRSGEDIASEIRSFALQGPRAICILSATGVVYEVTLCRPDSSGINVTYQGPLEILSMSGSFIPADNPGNTTGWITITFSNRDGTVVGGRVTGVLLAAHPVQVVVGSFLPNNQKPKPESNNPPVNTIPAIAGSSSAPPPPQKPKPESNNPPLRTVPAIGGSSSAPPPPQKPKPESNNPPFRTVPAIGGSSSARHPPNHRRGHTPLLIHADPASPIPARPRNWHFTEEPMMDPKKSDTKKSGRRGR